MDELPEAMPLWRAIWNRRWTLVLTVLIFVVAAIVYLELVQSVYRATARMVILENSPKVLGQGGDTGPRSDTFLQTQVDVIESVPNLSRALEGADYRSLKTLVPLEDDPIAQLRQQTSLKVEAGKKSDIVTVSLQSPYPEEARKLVNSIIDAYVGDLAQQKTVRGRSIVSILENERQALEPKREACIREMEKYREESGVSSFGDAKGNTIVERAAELSRSLTAAEIATMDLKAQYEAMKAAMATASGLSSYISAQQFKSRDAGDREYDEIRNELAQAVTTLEGTRTQLGANNRRVVTLEALVDSLKKRLAAKERAMAESELTAMAASLAAADAKERQLRDAVNAQRSQVAGLGKASVIYAELEAQLGEIQRQRELLDNRIAEVRANDVGAGPLKAQILERAEVESAPVWPNKALTMIIALLAGGLVGIGAGLWRESRDTRLRSLAQVQSLLGKPVLGIIPHMSQRLSLESCGQVVHLEPRSLAAEAYRQLRSSLDLNSSSREARTILLVSPMPGDGKSTTASNLAIAYSKSGYRTVLVDCNLRRPVQHLIFGAEITPDLASVATNGREIPALGCPTPGPELFVLPCVPVPEDPAELLGSSRFEELLHSLSREYDRIVIDSPALMHVTDGRTLATLADTTVMVLRMNRTDYRLAQLALDELDRIGANVAGVVANDQTSLDDLGRLGMPSLLPNRLLSTTRRRIEAQLPGAGMAGKPLRNSAVVDDET